MNDFMQNQHLDGSSFFLEGNQDCVLLFHGFSATTEEVRPLALELNKAGYSVKAPVLPGHNTSPEDLKTTKYNEWIDCAETNLSHCLKEFNKVFVGGESMGGLLTCLLAERYKEIQGLLLFAPALRVKNIQLVRFLQYFKPYIGDGDVNKEQKEKFPWKGYVIKPAKAVNELRKLQKIVGKQLEKIHQPTIIFQGVHDQTIDPESSEIIYKRISSKDKSLNIMQNSGHVVILDWEFDEVLNETLRFLGRYS